MFIKQLSVFIENQEGRLEQVLEVLKQEGAVPKEIFLLSLDGQGRVSCVRKEGL